MVMTHPASRITSALAAGRSDSPTPSKLARANTPRASTATRPTPVIVSARPTLKATIKQQSEGDAMQRDRGEQHDERGRTGKQSAGDADGEQRAPAQRRSSCVVVMVVMAVRVRTACRQRAASTDAPIETTRRPEARLSHGIEVVRHDELREGEA